MLHIDANIRHRSYMNLQVNDIWHIPLVFSSCKKPWNHVYMHLPTNQSLVGVLKKLPNISISADFGSLKFRERFSVHHRLVDNQIGANYRKSLDRVWVSHVHTRPRPRNLTHTYKHIHVHVYIRHVWNRRLLYYHRKNQNDWKKCFRSLTDPNARYVL